jgi:hypothetical protein
MIRRWLTLASGALLLGCSWSRFDDVTSDTPVVILDKPGGVSAGFGTAMTPLTLDGRALLLVHGTPGRSRAALFDLGTGTSPLEDALSENFCTSETGGCFLGSSSAAIPRGIGPSGKAVESCYALGLGEKLDNPAGILIECADKTVFTIDVTDDIKKEIEQGLENALPEIVALASDDREEPALVGGFQSFATALYYPSIDADFVPLDVPLSAKGPGFGQTVNIARVDDRNLVVVGAPEQDSIYLFSVEDGASPVPSYLGCVRGEKSFGRALASGPVFEDVAAPMVAVSDLEQVLLFDAGLLLQLGAGAESECVTLAGLPRGAEVTSLGCGETGAVKGCGASDFGVSVAIGDVDGDDDGELVVGAPGMKARDASNAGAVAYFDLEDPADTELTDLKFIASAESGDRLGTSLAAARIESRHVVVAGVPGSGRSAVFYCPSFLPGRLGGGRCD